MKKKNWITLALAAAVSAGLLTGCGVKSLDETESSASSASEETAAADTTEVGNTESSDTESSGSASANTSSASASASGDIEKATSGSLTVYTALEDDIIEKYLTSFYEKYPDIELNIVRDSTGTIVAKMIAEKDNPVADVVWGVAATVMLQLDPYDLIQGYTPEGSDLIDERFKDTENEEQKWTGIDVSEAAFLVNTDLCEEAGVPVPQSYEDLLDPQYKGAIVMPDPTSSGTGVLFVNGILQIMGEEDGWAYLTDLNENVVSYTTSGSKPAKMAASGECMIGISMGYRCAQLYQEGNPVEVVFPTEGSGWDVEANCLIKKDEINPVAYTFLDWAISDEAMAAYSTEYPITSRGVIGELPEGYSKTPMENLCELDLVQAATDRDSILDQFSAFLVDKVAE